METTTFGLGFHYLPRNAANVKVWKNMFHYYIAIPVPLIIRVIRRLKVWRGQVSNSPSLVYKATTDMFLSSHVKIMQLHWSNRTLSRDTILEEYKTLSTKPFVARRNNFQIYSPLQFYINISRVVSRLAPKLPQYGLCYFLTCYIGKLS